MAIVAIFALVLIYGASFAIRITHGFSKTVEMPEYIIRLQILNGCGETGVAAKMAKDIPSRVKLPLEVSILEVGDFDSYDIRETLVISREKDMDQSKRFAEQLGIDSDKVLYRPLENNYRGITTTLVIGDDYEMLLETEKQEN
jgi:hypothetical protein